MEYNSTEDVRKQIERLTLTLAYLTAWEEKAGDTVVRRAWKGYDFDVLDALEAQGLIVSGKKSKSLFFTEAGEAKVRELIAGVK